MASGHTAKAVLSLSMILLNTAQIRQAPEDLDLSSELFQDMKPSLVIGTQILSSALAPLEVTDLHHPFPITPSSYLHIYYISIRFNRVRTISCVPTLWNGVRKTQYSRDVKVLKLEWGNTHSLSTQVATPTHQNHTLRHFSSQSILENSKTWHQEVKPIDKMSIILL